jgi:hypothetical protein
MMAKEDKFVSGSLQGMPVAGVWELLRRRNLCR